MTGNTRDGNWIELSGREMKRAGGGPYGSMDDLDLETPSAPGGTRSVEGKKESKGDFLSSASAFFKWTLLFLPILVLIWIPGVLSIFWLPNATILGVVMLWWSIWLTVVWAGWWAALAATRILPILLRWTLGAVAASTRRYIDWVAALRRYIALFGWTITIRCTWLLLIVINQRRDISDDIKNTTSRIGNFLFGLFICAAILLFEKFSIQWIAGKFHERSYAERIADQKFAIKSLAVLYQHSSNATGPDPLVTSGPKQRKLLKQLKQGVKTTTTALGNVASQITGGLTTAPQTVIKSILESQEKSYALSKRIFQSFAQPGSDYLLVEDIARFFRTPDDAQRVFALFDKDSNGDASQEEVEMACLDFHREQWSIEHSMRDLDSAVGRLDNILMTVYVVVAAIVIAASLEAQVFALLAGAGTLILGLSWLIGGSLQEVLTSIIFLFIKHPFDVGDRVDIEKESYTVKEIRLLSTVFLNSSNVQVQSPNTVLNTLFIQNIRRSPQMSETYTFDVCYDTSFEDLARLKERMLRFVKSQSRDFQPSFDVMVKDFPDQEKMTLSAEIKYKSNGQQGAVKAKRKNRWLCALKTALAEVKIYGPGGNPALKPPT